MEERFRFVQDDDAHWYLIPAHKRKQFDKWVEAGPYWDNYKGEDFSKDAIGCSPSQYTFTDPKD
jgi:hypothetical protein